ncbi:hypothetical protein H1P_400002 [Hyella patelloides LEGE 07179]|uniref:Uncharacterized protein n=1 Tax=Hyella patelloides LEGE 07179 TaxID=945734 RepID=A0A563VX98_9CYAN|nr:hypothetical protein [Hyella patelloides]VEP16046.1 hypothetical protein H1P_400002 [Hyella patelloides LEGE 07179]
MNIKTQYQKMVAELLERNIRESDGLSEATVISFEIEHNLNLPDALRKYYRLLGNLKSINQAHDRLLHLDKIIFKDGKLIFFS